MAESQILVGGQPISTDAMEVLRQVCFAYVDPHTGEKGVPALAAKMGMSPGTLYNKLNLNGTTDHVPTVPELVQITAITGDTRVVKALCLTFGLVAFPVPKLDRVSDMALLELVNNVGAEGGDFHRAINAALAARRCTPRAVATIHKEGFEFIGAIAEAMERVKGLIDG